ncbi:hypothetical protein EMWEY_00060050, partial [Eimeria maxima]
CLLTYLCSSFGGWGKEAYRKPVE